MHKIQRAILDLARTKNLGKMSLRDVAAHIGEEPYPQKIKYHIDCLIENGFLKMDRLKGIAEVVVSGSARGVVSLPLMGAASAGPATVYANDRIEGYLQVSSSLLPRQTDDFFVIRVVGNSMNNADVQGQSIENGDFIIVDGKDRAPQDKQYVVSVIGDVANIKKLRIDRANGVIALTSESKQQDEYPPIFIDTTQDEPFSIAGRVIRVLKNPNNL